MKPEKSIAIFFSKGALGDCARHAILQSVDNESVTKVKVFSTAIETLEDKDWKCGCSVDHGEQLKSSPNLNKLKVSQIKSFDCDYETFSKEVDLQGVDAVITGLGNRQIFLGDRVAKRGISNILRCMKENGVNRLIAMSSMGLDSKLGNDKPCMEWRKEGKFMELLFKTICRREYNDLVGAENEVATSGIDYTVVRPVGLGEKVFPSEKYFIQKQKFEDVLCPNMAKSDVSRFLIDEVLQPSYIKKAVVIGGDPKDSEISF